MEASWLHKSIYHPWKVLVAGLVFIGLCAAGLQNLYFNGDYKVYFEKDDPQRVAFEQMQQVFTKNETANVVIAPENGEVFSESTLRFIKALTDALWQTPYSTRVDSLTNYQHTFAEEDDLIVEDLLLDADDLNDSKIAAIRDVALSEPNLHRRLVADDAEVAMIVVTLNLPDGDKTSEVLEVAGFVRETAESLAAEYPKHGLYYTGIVYMNEAFAVEAQRDAQTLVPGMFVVILLVLWLLLRSLLGTLATTLIIVFTIVVTLGIGGWLGFYLSTATVNVPTLVMTLAVADCVHVIASMMFEMQRGQNKQQALARSLKLNFMPILITSATTAIGFLTLNFSNVPALRDLGNLSAIGILLAFVFSVTLLPALLAVLPVKAPRHREGKQPEFMQGFANGIIRHHRKILPVTLVLVAGSIAAASLNRINDVATEYFDNTSPFRQSTDFQTEHLSGMSTMDFAVSTGQESGINDPAVLEIVSDFALWLSQQDEVDHVSVITDTFRRLNKNMHADDEAYYRLPEEQELAAQYLLLYEMSLPYGLDLNNQLDINKSATRVMVTLQNLGSKEFTEFEQRAYQWMAEHGPGLQIAAGSPNLMFAHIGETNMNSMLRGTLLALVLISGLLVAALRSWRMGAISLIPNLLPAGIGFGIWGLYSGEINMGLSVVLSMALGIIVDDTVHFLSKYQNARSEGRDTADAIRYAFNSVGKALWITTIVLTLGFAVLTLSSFALNAHMGLLTGIIIVVALAVDFILLPAFLMVFDNQQHHKEQTHATTG